MEKKWLWTSIAVVLVFLFALTNVVFAAGEYKGLTSGKFTPPEKQKSSTKRNVETIQSVYTTATSHYFVTSWGSSGTGNGNFDGPWGVAVDSSGNVYVTDTLNNRVQKFDSSGNFLTSWDTYGGGFSLSSPHGIAVDSSDNVFVADSDNDYIHKYDSSGNYLASWGGTGSGSGQLDNPWDIDIDSSDNLYVAEAGNGRVQKFNSSGSSVTTWSSSLSNPNGIEVDSNGYVYVSDTANDKIFKFTSDGTLVTSWGSSGTGDNEYNTPLGMSSDDLNNVFIADAFNCRIQKVTPGGSFIADWGELGSGDGQFNACADLETTSSGDIYVTDYSNNRIQKYSIPDWTFLIFLAADNNLAEGDLDLEDFNEMEEVGSSNDMRIIVQWDHSADYSSSVSWSGCRRYHVDKGTTDSIESTLIENMGTVDSGSPDVLYQFVRWGLRTYPAQKTAVILWDHGSGWRRVDRKNIPMKSICVDEDSGTAISTSEMFDSFSDMKTFRNGTKIDLMGMDACLMQMIEIAYGMRQYANVIVGSQASEPGYGWYYAGFLQEVANNTSMSASTVGKKIVQTYSDGMTSDQEAYLTLSAVDLTKLTDLGDAVDNFATKAINNFSAEESTLANANSNAQQVDSNYTDYKDLYDFAEYVYNNASTSELMSAAQTLLSAIDNAIIAEEHGSYYSDSHGLSVWLPNSTQYDNYSSSYDNLSFASDTNWDELLAKLVSASSSSSGGGGGGGGCFIATAAYGSYLDDNVMVLRNFRDDFLLKTKTGKAVVDAYYRYSPPAAEFIAEKPVLKAAARVALTPVVYGVKYPVTAVLILLLITATLALVTIRMVRKLKNQA